MRFIIDFQDAVPETTIEDYLNAHGCTVTSIFDALGKVYLVECSEQPPVTEIVSSVIRDDAEGIRLLDQEVTIREHNASKSTQTDDDDNWWKIAVLPNIDLEAPSFETYRVAAGIRVYLLDSGIDASHPEFEGKDITLLHSINGDFIDTTGHGTAMASVIVGETCGLTEASLKVVKIFNKGQSTYISDLLGAFDAVAKDYMNDPSRVAVMNLSWSIPKNDYVADKIRVLIDMGVIVSAAAGNSDMAVEDVTPAGMAEVETVGAFSPDLMPSNFTNYTGQSDTSYTEGGTNTGPALDLFAPGEMIRSAVVGGSLGYSVGTSIAAAIYSAVLACEIARANPNLSDVSFAEFVKTIRMTSRMRDLLSLEGKYAGSPNVTPRTSISPDDVPNHVRHQPSYAVAEPGKRFVAKLFDHTAYVGAKISGELEGWELKENSLVGIASEELTNGFRRDEIDVTLFRTPEETETFKFSVMTWDRSQHEDFPTAAETADITFLQCCPPTMNHCCGLCPKDNGECTDSCIDTPVHCP